MKWHEREKLIKEIKDYIADNVLYACKGVAAPNYAFRFDQGLTDILERYYATGSKN